MQRKKIFLGMSAVLAIGGLRAEEPVSVLLLQAIEAGKPSLVRRYLEQGALVNQKAGGDNETPLMCAIRAFAKEAEDRYSQGRGMVDMRKGLGRATAVLLAAGGIWLVLGGLSKVTGRNGFIDASDLIVPILVVGGVGYGTYKLFKGLGKEALSLIRLHQRRKVIELLLDYPTIDLFAINSKNQPGLCILHSYMLKNGKNPKLLAILKQVETMLLARQRKSYRLRHVEPEIKASGEPFRPTLSRG